MGIAAAQGDHIDVHDDVGQQPRQRSSQQQQADRSSVVPQNEDRQAGDRCDEQHRHPWRATAFSEFLELREGLAVLRHAVQHAG
ncbi:hypothetical protein D3C85_1464230 [compost metagenome]